MDNTNNNTQQSNQELESKSKKKRLITGLFIGAVLTAPIFAGAGYVFHRSNQFNNYIENLGVDQPLKYGQFLLSIGDLSTEKGFLKTKGHFRVSLSNLCNDTVLDFGKVSFDTGHVPYIADESSIGWNPDTSSGTEDLFVVQKKTGEKNWQLSDSELNKTFLLNPKLTLSPQNGGYLLNAGFEYMNLGLLSKNFEGFIADNANVEILIDPASPIASTGTVSMDEISAFGFVSKGLSAELNSEISEDTASEIVLKVSTKETAYDVWHIDFSETDLTLNVGSMASFLQLSETAGKTCSGYLVDQNQKFKVKSELNNLASKGMFINAKTRLSINSEAMTAKATVDLEPKMDIASGDIDLYKSLVYRAETSIPTSKLSQAQIQSISDSGFIDTLNLPEHYLKTEIDGEQMKIGYVKGFEEINKPSFRLSRFLDKKLTYTAQALYLLPYAMPVLAKTEQPEETSTEFKEGSNIRVDTDGTTRLLLKALN